MNKNCKPYIWKPAWEGGCSGGGGVKLASYSSTGHLEEKDIF